MLHKNIDETQNKTLPQCFLSMLPQRSLSMLPQSGFVCIERRRHNVAQKRYTKHLRNVKQNVVTILERVRFVWVERRVEQLKDVTQVYDIYNVAILIKYYVV